MFSLLIIPVIFRVVANAAPHAGEVDTSRAPQIDPKKGYFIAPIGQGVYWLTCSMYQTMFIVTSEGVIAVDAPWATFGEYYQQAIKEVTDKPVTHVIYSHAHRDHIGNADMFPANVTRIAHVETAKILKQRNDPKRPLPNYVCNDSCVVTVGGKRIQLDYKGVNHMPGNLFIYLPQDQVLMVVDIIYPGWVPYKNLAMAENAKGWLDAHDEILKYQFKYFVGGHVDKLGTKADVELQKEYFADVMANVKQAFTEVFPAMPAGNDTIDFWKSYKNYMDQLSQRCYDLTIPKWSSKLLGAELYTFDHCFSITEALVKDF